MIVRKPADEFLYVPLFSPRALCIIDATMNEPVAANFPTAGRIAAIDYGTVRIGIAVTDPDRRFASPFENYTRRDQTADARRFQQLVRDERVVGFVVGLPVHTSGNESQKSLESRRFGQWLFEVTKTPVQFFDERYTSVFAEEILGQAGFTNKRRKERRDMLAAQILLTAFLESAADRPDRVRGLDE